MSSSQGPGDWSAPIAEYETVLSLLPQVRELRAAQNEGRFTATPINLYDYRRALVLLSDSELLDSIGRRLRILDVGCYLNLFADFLNNAVGNKAVQVLRLRELRCTGIESGELYNRVSDLLFENNDLIRGDVARVHELTDSVYSVAVFCNFFIAEPLERAKVMEAFSSVDGVLQPGGLVLYNTFPSDANDYGAIKTAEGDWISPAVALPAEYRLLPLGPFATWVIARKRSEPDAEASTGSSLRDGED